MLQSLSIRDVVLIHALDLNFHPGMVVLTGETGAGKSILLDSLGLALGARAETSLIRTGASKAQVTATFKPPSSHPVHTLLDGQDIPVEENLIIIRRVLTPEGRNKCFINDQAVTQSLLKEVAQQLVEIHGQFDNLLDGRFHRLALDQYGSIDCTYTREAHILWKRAQCAYDEALQRLDLAKDREAFLRFSKEELETLSPTRGEEEQLIQQRAKVAHRAKISDAAQGVATVLDSEPIMSPLAQAQKSLQKVEDCLPELLTPLIETLERAMLEVDEATTGVEALLRDVQGDSLSLEALEDRLHDLRSMAKKHHVGVDDLPRLLDDLTQELSEIDRSETLIEELQGELDAAKTTYMTAAETLSKQRARSARSLETAMGTELVPLKLGEARLLVTQSQLDEVQWAAHGWDRLEFHVSTNPGTPAGPLQKVASGGELSRLMLALKVVLSQTTAIPSLVFDEIDTGTGGAVAAAIGERLKVLSHDMQVLVITHSPQVAALGDQHLQVTKASNAEYTTTSVAELISDDRLEEVARMLSGAEITHEARAQAKQLMQAA